MHITSFREYTVISPMAQECFRGGGCPPRTAVSRLQDGILESAVSAGNGALFRHFQFGRITLLAESTGQEDFSEIHDLRQQRRIAFHELSFWLRVVSSYYIIKGR